MGQNFGAAAFLRLHRCNFAIDKIRILKYRISRQEGRIFLSSFSESGLKDFEKIRMIIVENQLKKTGKKFSMSSLKRIVGKLNMRRKRVRKTVGRKRDPEESEKAPEKIEKERKAGGCDLHFPDRSGFSSGSSVPYAYQPVGETFRIPSSGGGRPDVTGFYSRDNRLESFCFKGTAYHSGVLSRCSDGFSETLLKKTGSPKQIVVKYLSDFSMSHYNNV